MAGRCAEVRMGLRRRESKNAKLNNFGRRRAKGRLGQSRESHRMPRRQIRMQTLAGNCSCKLTYMQSSCGFKLICRSSSSRRRCLAEHPAIAMRLWQAPRDSTPSGTSTAPPRHKKRISAERYDVSVRYRTKLRPRIGSALRYEHDHLNIAI